MNDRQNTVLATVLAGLVLVVVFLCPWRVTSSDEIRWSPIYQPPLKYVRTYDPDAGQLGGSRIESAEAKVAFDLLALEVLVLGAAGGVLYVLVGNSSCDDDGSV